MRTGAEYLKSLDDGRTVFVDGEVVGNVAEHPAFSSVAGTVGQLFDFAADPANGMQSHAEELGSTINVVYSIPRSSEDLHARRRAIAAWAKRTHGWLGRSPDHLASAFAGFAANAEVFDTPKKKFSQNVRNFYEHIARNSLFVSYAIIPPQYSRASTASQWGDDFIQVGVVRETEEGLIVRGSQMLATSGAIADELFVTCLKPLKPEDSDFAISFAIPLGTPGLKLISRRPYAIGATSEFDYPLTSRYDEPDGFVVFDDVLVPWDRVFVDRDVERVREPFFRTPAHPLMNWQAQIRFVEKLKFIASVARRITQVNETDQAPGTVEKLGELAALVTSVEAAVLAAQAEAGPDEHGTYVPARKYIYGAMGLQGETYPRVIQLLREIASGGVMQLPSSVADMVSSVTRPDVERYIRSRNVESKERIKLFRLAWDVIGSEFGGRHQQYEIFYAGSSALVKSAYTYNHFGYEELLSDLEEFLISYDLPAATQE
ncbi:4-hydroxyphenylacetate 3-hydroxylase family protein [Nesterenkonia muleiensis]|uniref:4-hydroxyphenylacetate 3-hydroxylase family protein n=1 Tax=Nesterenkonia muleiensis TaxID=2282648 RepID=UPI000E7386D3|nr:4-hydroxyphenylacetate 3-hydroxylase N-terminal domain-containing protein [Nesterenkonia muleiensis]